MSHIVPVPALGGVSELEVVELLVQPGETVAAEQPIAVLESDKSSLEMVADASGVAEKWLVSVGDNVAPGTPLLQLSGVQSAVSEKTSIPEKVSESRAPAFPPQRSSTTVITPPAAAVYASPAVRQMARHLEIPLDQVVPTGDRGRTTIADLKRYVHQRFSSAPAAPSRVDPQSLPDKEYWGQVRARPLSKIKRLTAERLLQQWQQIPHVTQFNEAVIDDLQEFRGLHKKELAAEGVKLTLLPFVIQALARSLSQFPQFNAVLSADGAELFELEEINIALAVETPDGLMVPVLRSVERQTLKELALGIQELAQKARDKQLMPSDMQGHTFTISSLGGYGGTAFTPIIHAPNVAILGLSRSQKRYGPGGSAQEMLPLSLSYDHRVIDGAEAARFLQSVVQGLEDLRLLCLG